MGRSFWRYFVAQAVSNLGTYVGQLALGFLIYDLTGSTLAMGALYLVSSIPANLLRLLGAPLIDRLPRLKLMAFLDITRACIYLLPWFFFQTGHPHLWALYLLAFTGGLADGLYSPTAMAIIPSIVPADKLTKANGLLSTVMNALFVIGPMVGIAICAFLGNPNALLLDGISFLLCGLVLALAVKHPVAATPPKRNGVAGYRAELVEGFTVFRKIPALFTITLVLIISNMGSTGSITVLLPFIRQHLGVQNVFQGTLQSAMAVGLLAASLVAGTVVLRVKRRILMLSGLLAIQIAQVLSALLTPHLAVVMVVAWGLYGFGSGTYSAHSQTIYQQLVPDHLRGRVMSVRILAGYGFGPIGAFLGTLIADQWGPAATFLICGGIPLIITLSAFFMPSLQALDRIGEQSKAAEPDSPQAKQGASASVANSSQ